MSITHSISQPPRLIGRKKRHLAESMTAGREQRMLRLKLPLPREGRESIISRGRRRRRTLASRLGIRQHLRSRPRRPHRMTPHEYRRLRPNLRGFDLTPAESQERRVPPLHRQSNRKGLFRSVKNGVRPGEKLQWQQPLDHLALVRMRHGTRTRHHDQHRPPLGDSLLNRFPRLRWQRRRRHIAHHDHIKLHPFLKRLR